MEEPVEELLEVSGRQELMSASIHPFLALTVLLLSQSHLRSALFHSEARPKFSCQGVSPRLP